MGGMSRYMKQGNEHFREFISEFDQTLPEAGAFDEKYPSSWYFEIQKPNLETEVNSPRVKRSNSID
jgi:hypothetical protein